ncbi:hypothetical protein B0H13DRAFT_2373074 [Mycena leptocephala]|nr:hypothetical protein B0H13DRAFT_2373074 [Mycena leptocephala]
MRRRSRREAIDCFALYLQWAIPGYLVELKDAVDPPDADESDSDSEPDDIVDSPSANQPAYTIAKKAPFARVTVASLESDYGAADFLSHLENFLREETILPPWFHEITATFPVYKRVVIKIPAVVQVSDSITNDPIIWAFLLAKKGPPLLRSA